ncbi:hypothetical protein EV383_5251 [Pseudonocardia sediminis]|uniref:Uncharacterized protein n=1 Tax=Pseudonocardia sediminis TaxID=1397368 RepID=A0A4Q7V1D1_PSEST|nr:hypothetical protein [Pseudonocardia sediminis]RZT88312.1 hypothetical protein EV383_5251 [Pseudonocardia sediminis]
MAEDGRSRGRGAPDPVALICGLLALVVAGYGYSGLTPGTGVDLRWGLAVVAVLAGVSFIVMSLRGSGNSRTTSDD